VLIANDFYTGKNSKLAPNYKGLTEIININDTKVRVKVGNKVLYVEKLKLFLGETKSDTDNYFVELNFNGAQFDRPITRMRAKLIKYKEAAQLALTMLKNEEEDDAMCDNPFDQCPICDAEERYMKDNPRDKKTHSKVPQL
jgi:hypothetical protein